MVKFRSVVIGVCSGFDSCLCVLVCVLLGVELVVVISLVFGCSSCYVE